MQFPDETLMAYVDGEVDADTRRRIEAAMAQDPTLAERVARHRALRTDLGAAFGGVLDEPVPSRLLDAANSSGPRSATITDLNAARAAKTGTPNKRSWSWPEWTAIAASLLIGVFAGRSAMQSEQSEIFAANASGIVASGYLSDALDEHLSGTSTDTAVRIGLSFRSKGGNYCRSFTASGSTGFACREDDAWRIRALSQQATGPNSGEYRMAGTDLPPAILAAIDDIMEGDALDRDQEQAARERGWKK
jgi:hypothetical protein